MRFEQGQAVIHKTATGRGIGLMLPAFFVRPASKNSLLLRDDLGSEFEANTAEVFPSQEAAEARSPRSRATVNTISGRTTCFPPAEGHEVEDSVWTFADGEHRSMIVELYVGDTREIIVGKMRAMREAVGRGDTTHIACSISGYDEDRRELGEFPEVVAFCRTLVEMGFPADLCLSAMFWQSHAEAMQAFALGTRPPEPLKNPLGSFELWMLAEGRLGDGKGVLVSGEIALRYLEELKVCFDRSEAILGEGTSGP